MNTTEAEQVASGNNTSDVYPIGAWFKSQLGHRLYRMRLFTVFHVNTSTVHQNKAQPLPATSFPLHHSLIIQEYNALLYKP
jgi:hypothetical protein